MRSCHSLYLDISNVCVNTGCQKRISRSVNKICLCVCQGSGCPERFLRSVMARVSRKIFEKYQELRVSGMIFEKYIIQLDDSSVNKICLSAWARVSRKIL
ncbi:unnamed protein product [Meganyctiphanes norvegica]|uniref:Uncharacterized protein n=1 Tax=Meganyctiphanes norvegica TaxID=48144 RepID=A0AAV2RB23_MEGNR